MNPKILENQVWATIGIVVNKRNAHEVIDIIMKSPQIYLATISLGRFNVIIAGHFQNIGLLNSFVTHELVSIDGVGSVETFIHDKPLKYYNIPLYDFEARN
jgi:DNA-binding Lrp family transcriptional regulator